MVTPGYAPLEQYYEGGEQGAWTDIYSVGAVGYKMITGENPPEAVSRVKDDKIKDLSLEYRGEYSKELLETIDACLRMDENERPRSIVEVLEMLRVGRGEAEVNRSRKVVNKNYVGAPRLNANVWNRDRVARAVEDSKVRETYAGQGDRLAKFDNGAIWHYTKVVLKKTIFFLKAALLCLFLIPVFYSIIIKFNTSTPEEKTFRLCYESAKQGDAIAQNNLGNCYWDGIGVEKNYDEAFKWYKKSAEQGYANAQFMLGNCYQNGIGVKKNDDEAFNWYKKSAEQGNKNAQFMLGQCYWHGIGVKKNYDEAIKWYNKSAK